MAEETGDLGKVQYKSVILNNNSSKTTKMGLFSLTGAVIVLCSVGCEIGKQISNYSINYYNGGRYPLPQTIMVRRMTGFLGQIFIVANFRLFCWSF